MYVLESSTGRSCACYVLSTSMFSDVYLSNVRTVVFNDSSVRLVVLRVDSMFSTVSKTLLTVVVLVVRWYTFFALLLSKIG